MKAKKSYYEHITITGKYKNFDKVVNWLYTMGYETLSSGDKRTGAYTVDDTRFTITARRNLTKRRLRAILKK